MIKFLFFACVIAVEYLVTFQPIIDDITYGHSERIKNDEFDFLVESDHEIQLSQFDFLSQNQENQNRRMDVRIEYTETCQSVYFIFKRLLRKSSKGKYSGQVNGLHDVKYATSKNYLKFKIESKESEFFLWKY